MSTKKYKHVWYPYSDEYGNDLYWLYDYKFVVKLSRNKPTMYEFVVIGYAETSNNIYRDITSEERWLAMSIGLHVLDGG